MRGARPAIAGTLMIIAIIAVICVVDKDTSVAEDCEGLSREDCQRAKGIGEQVDEAEAAKAAEQNSNSGEKWKEHQEKAQDDLNAIDKQVAHERFGNNCLTLKAYAIEVFEDTDEPPTRALNTLLPLLEGMRTNPEKDNSRQECMAKFNKLMDKLMGDTSIDFPNSIGKQMLETVKLQMKHHRGILLYGRLTDRSAACDDEIDQRDCMFKGMNQGHSQMVYMDASRTGYSGNPGVFQRLAIRGQRLLDRAHHMAETTHHHTHSIDSHASEVDFTHHDGYVISTWSGK